MKANRSKKQLSKQEIASFCDQMAMIIKAGITPKDGLELMLTDTKDEATRAVLEELLKYSRLGEPFSTCVKSSEYFPNYVINMIALGEETGQLDDVLVALCHYYEHEEYISENLRSAVTYPVVMIIMMLLIIIILVTKVLWLFGIHGAMVTLSVIAPTLMAMNMANQAAAAAGQEIPNIICYAFYNVYTLAGGIIGLAICMLTCKSEKFKALNKVCFLPAVFGISEPLMFGIPLVLNPQFAIPFVISPIITVVGGYLLTKVGFLPRLPGVGAPAGTPVIIQGLISGGWKVALYQAVCVVVLVLLWMPFVNMADNEALKQEQEEI